MRYHVHVGINYPDPLRPGHEKRAEPGEVVDDLPAGADLAALIGQGVLSEATDATPEPVPGDEGFEPPAGGTK